MVVAACCVAGASAQTANADVLKIPEGWLNTFTWRVLGPAGMGGRVTSLAVNPQDPSNYFVGMATAGVLRTKNNGITFEHIFDNQPVSSVGDVAVAPSNPNVVWVGTGESNPRNSVSYGNGVYKSTDGGTTWTYMGLPGSYQIGAIVIDSKNPDIVYVGALGRLWGPNEERGVFKTTDGGKTWTRSLFVNRDTGVVDMVIDPKDPNTIYAATWERRRGPYDSYPGENPKLPEGIDAYDPIVKWGWGSGIYKTTDAGKSWRKLGRGLPTVRMGRIGLDIWQKNTKTLFAVIDTEKVGTGPRPPSVTIGASLKPGRPGALISALPESGPAVAAGLKVGDVITAIGATRVTSPATVIDLLRTAKVDDKWTLTYRRDGKEAKAEVKLVGQGPGPSAPTVRGTLGLETEDAPTGQRVVTVRPGRLGEELGVKVGDIVNEFGGKPITTLSSLQEALAAKYEGNKTTMKARRGEETVSFNVTLPDPDAGQRFYAAQLFGQRENVQEFQGAEGFQTGGVYRSDDGGESWRRINSVNPRPMYFSKVRVDPQDDKFLYVLGISMYRSSDGGDTFTADASNRVHSDQHALWVNPRDGRHMIVGTDGGWYTTHDRTERWEHHNVASLSQFYSIAVDNQLPYWVYGGLQDNGSWAGPSTVRHAQGPMNEDWLSLNGGDGFICRVDPNDANILWATSQDGNIVRRNLATGEFASIRPRAQRGVEYRFNWNTPFILSSHNPGMFYSAGNFVFRSFRRGDELRPMSPEITRTTQGSATALSESPLNPNVMWVGTDDGFIWVTKDNGANWTNVTSKLGNKNFWWVGSIEASRFAEGRAYVALTGHRSDSEKPSVWMTEDFGETWKEITTNLPEFGSTRCLREDVGNPNLLYAGTETGLYATLDRGLSWFRFNNNLPTVPVYDVAVHPTQGDLVAATHGRGAWAVEVTPLRQMSLRTLSADVNLFEPKRAWILRRDVRRGTGDGHEKFYGQNGVLGASIFYALKQDAKSAALEIFDGAGRSVRRFTSVSTKAGFYRQTWEPSATTPTGTYRVVLTVDGKTYEQPLRIELDPLLEQARRLQAGH